MVRVIESGNQNIGGGGIEEFQWSTSEQVWPFEKTSDGKTLYCKEIICGAAPENGIKQVTHNITLNSQSVKKFDGIATFTGSSDGLPIPFTSTASAATQIQAQCSPTSIYLRTGGTGWTTSRILIHLWYIKD